MPKGDCAMETAAGWSARPGARCLTCGKQDPWDRAIADGNFEPNAYTPDGLSSIWKPGAYRLYDFNCGLRGKE